MISECLRAHRANRANDDVSIETQDETFDHPHVGGDLEQVSALNLAGEQDGIQVTGERVAHNASYRGDIVRKPHSYGQTSSRRAFLARSASAITRFRSP